MKEAIFRYYFSFFVFENETISKFLINAEKSRLLPQILVIIGKHSLSDYNYAFRFKCEISDKADVQIAVLKQADDFLTVFYPLLLSQAITAYLNKNSNQFSSPHITQGLNNSNNVDFTKKVHISNLNHLNASNSPKKLHISKLDRLNDSNHVNLTTSTSFSV